MSPLLQKAVLPLEAGPLLSLPAMTLLSDRTPYGNPMNLLNHLVRATSPVASVPSLDVAHPVLMNMAAILSGPLLRLLLHHVLRLLMLRVLHTLRVLRLLTPRTPRLHRQHRVLRLTRLRVVLLRGCLLRLLLAHLTSTLLLRPALRL